MIHIKIGIMQPYFFPYLGYYSLMKYTDYFILFDTPQFIRKGFINRNRILDAKGKPLFVTAPIVGASRETRIKDTKISYTNNWFSKIYGQLTAYKKRAPYYEKVLELLHDVESKHFLNITDLNAYTLDKTAQYIGISFHYDIFSKMNLRIDEVYAPDEWALNITKALGYDTYVNPPGGLSFFDKEKYIKNDIKLQFLQNNLNPYSQRNGTFVEGLSILDAMMFLDPQTILELLDDFTIIE